MSTVKEQQRTAAAPPAATSPFICLSTQCDVLYRVGALPHSFAFISEQSVYTRAVEQLRYATPSPNVLLAAGGRFAGSDAAAPCQGSGDDVNSLPHVYINSQPPNPFPFIQHFEAVQRAAREQEERRAKAHHRSSTAPVKGSGDEAKNPPTKQEELLSSGPLLAQRTYRHDYEYRGREGHSNTTAAAPHGDAAEQTAGSLFKDSAPVSSPSLQLVFPSPVLLRAVAQLVLTMQASSSTSAARFALAQYRGVQLLPWRASLHEVQELAAPSTPRLSPEAVVVSVLPQVVIDRATTRARATSGQLSSPDSHFVEVKDSATLYALVPLSGPHAQSGTQGVKRAREEAPGAILGGAAVNATTAAVVAGAVLCERLATTTEASAAQTISVRYAAVTADGFEGWMPRSGEGKSSPSPTPSKGPCVAEPVLYEEESTWMTDGVYRPLFSLPLASPAETSVAGGAKAPASENSSSGQSTTHAAFVKTSAFLFLSFLVHHSWCVHVHSVIAQALAAHRLPSNIGQQIGSAGLAFTVSHVTCLPPVQEVRRSPQYEWRSMLVYRRYDKQTAGGTAVPPLRHGPALWQLAILVVNRKAQLQWSMCDASPVADIGADSAAASSRPNEHEGIWDRSGSLDDLLHQL
ncbi:hypothetical protein GH5_01870 [Leishmania sp. Ghana 2012 LV757]|uniref:hypothetical protein n=1 Tax=Leishmania sp. Ghana 2012 LV757 TaxID=2803181 RepID=UPI001B5D2CC3|nr:hypothetical protein GH5_01870 [Leishmania sp. Ghana 2012 LV757]